MEKDLPMDVLEVYDTIEKLLSPGEHIINENRQASRCILYMLNDLFEKQSAKKENEVIIHAKDLSSKFCFSECSTKTETIFVIGLPSVIGLAILREDKILIEKRGKDHIVIDMPKIKIVSSIN